MSHRSLALKHPDIEERIDLLFYRPLGAILARWLVRTPATPDAVTIASGLIGIAAGHALLYGTLLFDLLALGGFIVANLLDSVDGQLARLKGVANRRGRILDGVAGAAMFASFHGHLAWRLYRGDGDPMAFILGLTALLSQAVQNWVADYYRNAYLACGVAGAPAELDTVDTARRLDAEARQRGGLVDRVLFGFYVGYVTRQEMLAPSTARLYRRIRSLPATDARALSARERYVAVNGPLLRHLPWLATNLRALVLFALVLAGRPSWYFPIIIGPFNAVLAWMLYAHERNSRQVMREIVAP